MNFVRILLAVFLVLSVTTTTVVVSRTTSGSAQGPPVAGFDRFDFVRIAEAGFGDPMNNYAFSMAEFKGDVYVGTARNFVCRILEGILEVMSEAPTGSGALLPQSEPSDITCAGGEPWSQEHAQDMCAEIWRYHGGQWKRVYQSVPVNVSGWPGFPPEGWVAKEPGFRSMTTFTDKRGQEAIYAASGVSLIPGRLLLKSTNGSTWDEVVTPLVMGSDSRSMAVHNGKLYVAPALFQASATIWATDDPATSGDGSNWQKVADFTAEEPGTDVAVVSMASFNGYLYAGTQNDESGFQVWRSNAQSPGHPELNQWTKIVDYGAGDMSNTRALTMKVFKGSLYVGSSMFPLSPDEPYILPPKGCELIRIAPGETAVDKHDLLIAVSTRPELTVITPLDL